MSHICNLFAIFVILGEKVPLLALVGHPSSDGVRIKRPYGVDALLY